MHSTGRPGDQPAIILSGLRRAAPARAVAAPPLKGGNLFHHRQWVLVFLFFFWLWIGRWIRVFGDLAVVECDFNGSVSFRNHNNNANGGHQTRVNLHQPGENFVSSSGPSNATGPHNLQNGTIIPVNNSFSCYLIFYYGCFHQTVIPDWADISEKHLLFL